MACIHPDLVQDTYSYDQKGFRCTCISGVALQEYSSAAPLSGRLQSGRNVGFLLCDLSRQSKSSGGLKNPKFDRYANQGYSPPPPPPQISSPQLREMNPPFARSCPTPTNPSPYPSQNQNLARQAPYLSCLNDKLLANAPSSERAINRKVTEVGKPLSLL